RRRGVVLALRRRRVARALHLRLLAVKTRHESSPRNRAAWPGGFVGPGSTRPRVAEASMSIIKALIVACLVAIVVSLGSALFHLVHDKGESKKMARALTVRVALSVALFVLLFIAWSFGLIQPHGIE